MMREVHDEARAQYERLRLSASSLQEQEEARYVSLADRAVHAASLEVSFDPRADRAGCFCRVDENDCAVVNMRDVSGPGSNGLIGELGDDGVAHLDVLTIPVRQCSVERVEVRYAAHTTSSLLRTGISYS